MSRLAFALFAGFLSSASLALDGRVVGVADGDTLTVLDSSKQTHKVRLAEIDAPEKAMPFGQRAKQRLSDLCYLKNASITKVDTDRYGRVVARVSCDGVDVNHRLVAEGMAWVYRQYATTQSFYLAEEDARKARIGLWRDSDPTPPWLWRKKQKE